MHKNNLFDTQNIGWFRRQLGSGDRCLKFCEWTRNTTQKWHS